MDNPSSQERHRVSNSSEQLEFADYLLLEQQQLYYVLHPTTQPLRARILLAGPFASERPHRYIPWVRWARHLANNGYEVMRFDYRGVGESTGQFEEYGLKPWSDDLRYCAEWLQQRSPTTPLILHGLGMGALLSEKLFAQEIGHILLNWLPPKSARDMLYEQLKVKLSNNFSLPSSERKTRDQFIAELEGGKIIEVEGHNWTPHLWAEAAEFVFGSHPISDTNKRISHIGQLDALAAHTFGGVGPNPLRGTGGASAMRLVNPDLSLCFSETTQWLNDALDSMKANGNA